MGYIYYSINYTLFMVLSIRFNIPSCTPKGSVTLTLINGKSDLASDIRFGISSLT